MIHIDTNVWSRVLDGLRREIGADRFNLWFRNTKLLNVESGDLVIGVPNLFVMEWMRSHYGEVIGTCASAAMGAPATVRFEVDPSLFAKRREEQAEQEAAFLTGAARGNLTQPAELLERTNPRMRLETYVVGDCNRLAYTAACEVVRAPGQVFNPLFLHGSTGVGKTHLLQGIAAALGVSALSRSCLYITCEEFTNQYITAMRTHALDSFRRRFRRLDVLILDDVHFFTNKPATQEEFLHTFNALVDITGKQVVLASDSHPRTIKQLKEGLIARFISGMVARIDPPDEATRVKLLQQKAAGLHLAFQPGVIEYLARTFEGNVRELEGMLTALAAHASLEADRGPARAAAPAAGLTVGMETVQESLARLKQCARGLTGLADIDRVVAAYFGIAAKDLQSACRRRTLSFPRQVAMFLGRRYTTCSLAEIGQRYGNRDHSTVAGACKRMARLVDADESIRQLVELLEAHLRHKTM